MQTVHLLWAGAGNGAAARSLKPPLWHHTTTSRHLLQNIILVQQRRVAVAPITMFIVTMDKGELAYPRLAYGVELGYGAAAGAAACTHRSVALWLNSAGPAHRGPLGAPDIGTGLAVTGALRLHGADRA